MTLFRSMTLRWWQISMFKVGLLALGLIIGARWPQFFRPLSVELAFVGIVCLAYIGWVWLRSATPAAA